MCIRHFYEDSIQYIVLEYAENSSLFFYINAQKGLPENIALRFLYQVICGVNYLHKNNIIHRDIKPENLLLDSNMNIKICDFGWSCYHSMGDNLRDSICGTFEYMSPEIVGNVKHDYKVDIWCLGILFYELLHGYMNRYASI